MILDRLLGQNSTEGTNRFVQGIVIAFTAIAVSSMLTEIAMGKSLTEAKQITNKDED